MAGHLIESSFRESQALLVVSDTHFGGEYSSREFFLHFPLPHKLRTFSVPPQTNEIGDRNEHLGIYRSGRIELRW
ncbi:MAG: hypothetical protein WBZ42_05575 [Halobacteriota archaeon]